MESSSSLAAILIALFALLAIAALAFVNWLVARGAEREHPPAGRFITVDGVRLHYREQGCGPPVVLLHGNGAQSGDFVASGLMDELAAHYRVIAFDRPGFGYSRRPRRRWWSARAQAQLLARACAALNVGEPVVLGHSWGCLVALEMAFLPAFTPRGLVLVSGYYFPTARADIWLMAIPALPVIGDLLRYTISPVLAWLAMPRFLNTAFAPQDVPRAFVEAVPPSLMARPGQLRASAEESACLLPAVIRLARRYSRIGLTVEIFAGTGDRIVHRQQSRQSARLHEVLPHSRLHILPGEGHMLHHDLKASLVAAVDRLEQGEAQQDFPGKSPGAAPDGPPRRPPGKSAQA